MRRIATLPSRYRRWIVIQRLAPVNHESEIVRFFVGRDFPLPRGSGPRESRRVRASCIWNSRSKLSRRSVLEIDVMSARTGRDTGLLYLSCDPKGAARARITDLSGSFIDRARFSHFPHLPRSLRLVDFTTRCTTTRLVRFVLKN